MVFVGMASMGAKHVEWGLFGKIVLTWVVTLPFAAGMGAVLMAVAKALTK